MIYIAAEMKGFSGSNTTRMNYTIPTLHRLHYKHCTFKRRVPDILMQHKHLRLVFIQNSILGNGKQMLICIGRHRLFGVWPRFLCTMRPWIQNYQKWASFSKSEKKNLTTFSPAPATLSCLDVMTVWHERIFVTGPRARPMEKNLSCGKVSNFCT